MNAPTTPPPAKDLSTAQIMERLAKHIEKAGGGVLEIALKQGGGEWGVLAEFGQEASDSPMAGGAAYGLDEDLRRALETAAHDCRILIKEET